MLAVAGRWRFGSEDSRPTGLIHKSHSALNLSHTPHASTMEGIFACEASSVGKGEAKGPFLWLVLFGRLAPGAWPTGGVRQGSARLLADLGDDAAAVQAPRRHAFFALGRFAAVDGGQ